MSEHKPDREPAELGADADQRAVERLIRRDRRLVRGLTAITAGFWVLSAALVLTLYWMLVVYVMPSIRHLATAPPETVDPRRTWEILWYFGVRIGWPMAIAGAVLVLLAATCTVLLVHWSRQATLHAVDRRLEQILVELRRRDPNPPPACPPRHPSV